jgi:SAM-dependent methyltransferase
MDARLTDERRSVAERYGERWSAGAAVRAERFAELSRPAWLAVAAAVGVGRGSRVLDVACGSGEFGRVAADRGAGVAGIDAAAGMIELARRLVPEADLRVGTLEQLPWADHTFDVVTGFNAFQFAPDLPAALVEAVRVCRPGGRVAICNWGPAADCDLVTIVRALEHLQPGPTLVPRRPLGEPGVLEELARGAGLRPGRAGLVRVPYRAPEPATLTRDVLSAGNARPAVEHSGRDAVGRALLEAAAPFRRADGTYLLRNTFRYLICHVPPAPWGAGT